MSPGRLLLALAGAVLVVAGCSGPGGSSSSTTSTSSAVSSLTTAYTDVVRNVSPSVVMIQSDQGLGSGEIYNNSGDIVTNAHVVGAATSFVVITSSGRKLDASLVGTFPPDDIAVIKVANAGGLKPASWGDSSKLEVGQPVLAMGSPLGLEGSVTTGVVSALGRVVSEGPGGGTLPDAIQTSAPINPGNSGGALVDLDSQVIGIPTLAALTPGSRGAQAPGIAFAISSNRAKVIADQLVEHGTVTNSHRAYLGIQGADTTANAGVLVASVDAGGPAATAGITQGDLITSLDGTATPDLDALSTTLAKRSPGQTVPAGVTHPDGNKATYRVRLGELPST